MVNSLISPLSVASTVLSRHQSLTPPSLSSRIMRRIYKFIPSLVVGITLSWSIGLAGEGYAQIDRQVDHEMPDTPISDLEEPPAELFDMLAAIDAAASQQDLRGVLRFYNRDFTHADGLTYRSFRDALETFWSRFETLRYETELISWELDGDNILADTVTTITGTQEVGGEVFNLTAQIESRQLIQNGMVVEQTTLSEASELVSGENPPSVDFKMPEQVSIGQTFSLDAIVLEPLGDDILLGAVFEEPTRPEGYLNTAPISFEALSAGGLFKVGRAPAIPNDDRWISTVIIRQDGMTLNSQRLRVVSQSDLNHAESAE